MWDWGNPPFPIQLVEVPNTGFMRDQPTNCYLIGRETIIIVDPGSEPGIELIPQVLEERGSTDVQAIFLTHAHPDHAIATPELRRLLDVQVMLHPDNSPIMNQHISWNDVDIRIDPSRDLCVDELEFELVMTPGHAPGHVALLHRESGTMIAGDLVSGNGTIGVFPPNGSMVEYIDSLHRAKALQPTTLLPGHGPVIEDPDALFDHYLERRYGRESQILELLGGGERQISEILPVLYPDLLPEYSFPAEATILAHLQKLEHEMKVQTSGDDPKTSPWMLLPISE
jgi:endoribonuclease LACTB2